jgi:hypothetical protein
MWPVYSFEFETPGVKHLNDLQFASGFCFSETEHAKDLLRYYEDYDSKVFSMPNPNKRPNRGASSAGILRATSNTADLLASSLNNTGVRRKMSDPEARISRGGNVLSLTFRRLVGNKKVLFTVFVNFVQK